MNYTIKSDSLEVTISDLGAEMISAKGSDGHEYVWGADERFWDSHAPVLFPVCGRTLDNTYLYAGKSYEMNIHGFASSSVFEVIEKTNAALVMKLSANEKTLKNYPFNFELLAEYSVSGNTLRATYTVKNNDEKVMPYMLGWHPGFVLEGEEAIGEFALKFDDKSEFTAFRVNMQGFGVSHEPERYPIEGSSYALNEEEIYANDTMIFKGTGEHAVLSSPKGAHSIDMSWSENLPYFCIWKDDKSEARFVCLEPWSDIPGSGEVENFDTKEMSRLPAGKSETYCYTVKFN